MSQTKSTTEDYITITVESRSAIPSLVAFASGCAVQCTYMMMKHSYPTGIGWGLFAAFILAPPSKKTLNIPKNVFNENPQRFTNILNENGFIWNYERTK
jgi:hypothetical protein